MFSLLCRLLAFLKLWPFRCHQCRQVIPPQQVRCAACCCQELETELQYYFHLGWVVPDVYHDVREQQRDLRWTEKTNWLRVGLGSKKRRWKHDKRNKAPAQPD